MTEQGADTEFQGGKNNFEYIPCMANRENMLEYFKAPHIKVGTISQAEKP